MTIVAGPDGKLHQVLERGKSSPFPDARTTTVQGGRSISVDSLGLNETYSRIYATQPWVGAVVNKLARGLARIPLKSYRDLGEAEREYLRPRATPAHPLPVLLSRPYPRGSRFKLTEFTVGQLAIYSKACWWKFRPGAGKAPVELWPMDWRYMTQTIGGKSGVEYFEYNGPAGKRRFLPDDIVLFEWWSPVGPAGTSPLEQLRLTLALEEAGRGYAVSSFAHGVRPSGAITTPATLEPEEKAELRAEINSLNAGTANAFRIALLDGGMDWKPFAHTAQEAETIEHRKLNREEVCGVYDVPPNAVQILDKATFSNITEQNKSLYRETMGPWAALLEDTIESQLIWGEPAFANTYTAFDFNQALETDLPQRAAAYRQMETILTANERRSLENRPPIGAADDMANPANGILYPLNMGVVLPDGTLLAPPAQAGGAASALSAAIDQLVDERIAALTADRVRLTADE